MAQATELEEKLNKLLLTADPSDKDEYAKLFSGFIKSFCRHLERNEKYICWEKIEELLSGDLREYCSLEEPSPDEISNILGKLIVVKLNGGLGTGMNCNGPKSLIPVHEGNTFLDMTVWQIEHLNQQYETDVPLILMNSFCTDEETKNALTKYKNARVKIVNFVQGMYPRISQANLSPIATTLKNIEPEAWYPPGHGSFFEYFYNSGLCEHYINSGKQYCFVSNIDNLGATVDLNVLNTLVNVEKGSCEFAMEVTNKTVGDIKGGTLVRYEEKIRLLEYAQVPELHVKDFRNPDKFEIFNTNNLWIKLEAISRLVREDLLKMDIIVNEKQLINGTPVLQFETAAGAAMKYFENTCSIRVPRSRFLPVKTTSDFLLVKSNIYQAHCGTLIRNPQRHLACLPSVKLGYEFSSIEEFLKRIPEIPDILELIHLRIFGNVTFSSDISLKGTVVITTNQEEILTIQPGSRLENEMLRGNKRISTIKTYKEFSTSS